MNTKRCTKCGIEKPETDFHKKSKSAGGRTPRCKICLSVAGALYRKMNKEKISAQKKEYQIKNKQEISERGKEYRKNNLMKIRAVEKKRRANATPAQKELSKKWYTANKDRINMSRKSKRSNRSPATREIESKKGRELSREYRRNHPAERKAATAKWRAANKPAILESTKIYNRVNAAAVSARNKDWRDRNPAKCRAMVVKRRANLVSSTPVWYEKEDIEKVYAFAKWIRDSGLDVHVDHVVPLQGELVNGLHCLANLQIITAEENLKKGNTYTP